ncbi:MAG: DNA translocase FtsK [Verrucomicrobiota bacterium]
MGCGLLLFLALISYTPADLPSWVKFSRAAVADTEITNFIGPLGAVIAGYAYFFLGAACFLIPAILVWFGFQSLLGTRVLTLRNIASCTALVASGACLADVQSLFFLEWPARFNIYSPGGAIGYVVGQYILLKTIGSMGSLIVATTVYCVSLIVITGLHPMVFLHASYQGMKNMAANQREARAERRALSAEKADARGSRPIGPHQDLDVPATPKRTRTRKTAPEPEPAVVTPELPLQTLPTPKIIDSSVRNGDDKKPTLAELMAGRKKSKKKEHLAPEFAQFKDYSLPGSDILDPPSPNSATPANKSHLLGIQSIIVETLATFGITVTPGDITRGPTITRYEILPSRGLRVNRITALEADLARATKAERINIIAPIPGKDTVGIEIANSQKVLVPLRELLEDPVFHSNKYRIPLALGKDVYGHTIVGDLAAMPHCLIAGATGSGKSVCINSVIASILYRFSPDELRFIMIDPKVVEMQNYDNLPHLVVPVVTDPKKVILALRWVVNEMERRYRMFASQDVRDFDSFNSRKARRQKASRKSDAPVPPIEKEKSPSEDELVMHAVSIEQAEETDAPSTARDAAKLEFPEEEIPDKVPYIVVIIDELADLMQTAPVEVEGCIQRLAQKARAAGIHIILATQTPRKEVITGNIKTNVPTRIAFQVPSKIDSRVILDSSGAEKLVGQGDMLYLPPGSSTLQRAQGAFVTDQEIERLVAYCTSQADPAFESSIKESLESGTPQEETEVSDEDEEIIEKCIEVIQQEKRASTSLLQRRLRLGYTRAARMIDILEERGIIGPGDGAKPREILIDLADTVD